MSNKNWKEELANWIAKKLNVGLGAPLLALELQLAATERRAWKFTRTARVVAYLYVWAWSRDVPAPCEACGRTLDEGVTVCDACGWTDLGALVEVSE